MHEREYQSKWRMTAPGVLLRRWICNRPSNSKDWMSKVSTLTDPLLWRKLDLDHVLLENYFDAFNQ